MISMIGVWWHTQAIERLPGPSEIAAALGRKNFSMATVSPAP